ncbi:hypothetical protein [Botrimarina hoheduenensis]|uniref:Beta-porphyranase A n=1 Tax=Botrimarina hoheduenensis TaxID=2528000 RepID=A0A5C5VR55_9BACT|nr:hypothetical protein [Botrimarina hoheduenensis]TWT40627.1 Beta-porphyranase A precursor [Botrimarina hoheduenensis]
MTHPSRLVAAGNLLALVLAAPSVAAPPVGQGVAWLPIESLSDEFNTLHPNPRGDGIDDSKWWDDHPRWSGRMPSQFSAANSWVADGALNLRATPVAGVSTVPSGTDEQRNTHWIDTAAVVSKTQATAGSYFEASIKTADISLPSSFWFRMNSKSEIDVIENIGNPSRPGLEHRRSEMSFNTHFYNPPPDIAIGGNAQMTDESGDPLLSAENFITYAVWWKSPNEIVFYYNDVEVASVAPGGPFDEGLHMIFDMEAFHWVGFPSITDLLDPSKNTMQVDWVRAYLAVDLLPGDYDSNGSVDSRDYAQWRTDFGLTGGELASDGNGDGVVDAADYVVWRDAVVGGVGPASTPEPAGVSLAAVLIASSCCTRRRSRQLNASARRGHRRPTDVASSRVLVGNDETESARAPAG